MLYSHGIYIFFIVVFKKGKAESRKADFDPQPNRMLSYTVLTKDVVERIFTAQQVLKTFYYVHTCTCTLMASSQFTRFLYTLINSKMEAGT